MRPNDLWPTDAKIIEVGATRPTICQPLIAAGLANYLAVAISKQRCEIFSQGRTELRRRVVAAHSRKVIQQNNADVLILSGWSSLALWRIRPVRHAKYVAIRLQPTPLCWIAILLAFAQCLLMRLSLPRIVNCAAG